MGIKVEKKFGRQELAKFFADLSQQVESGKLEGETRPWTIPEQVDAAIHLKEEDGEVIAKIKLRWPAPEPALRGQISLKEAKARLITCFKELQRVISQGLTPEKKTMQDFVDYSQAFAAFIKPEWQEGLADYLVHLEKLESAVTNRQVEAMQEELQILVDRMIVCHREFKK